MNDFHYSGTIDQRASGTVTVNNWQAVKLTAATGTAEITDHDAIDFEAAATGSFTVTNYAQLNAAAATGTATVTNWENMIAAAATGTIQITDYTALAGKSFTIGGNTYIEGIHFVAETSDEVTAANLAAVATLDADFNAAAVATDTVTITAASTGVSGNSIGISTNAVSGVTLSGATLTGGREHASIDVAGNTYYQGSDFTAETSNDVTATNLAAAIDAGAEVGAAAVGAVVTITATTAGTAGNELQMTAGGEGFTISGATLTGGRAAAVITVGETQLTAGTDFTAETNNDTTATNIAAAIDALAAVTCSATGPTGTITAASTGSAGNIAYSVSGSGITGSGTGFLTGGVDGDTITVGATTKTFGTDIAKGATDADTAKNLKNAIHTLADTNATRSNETINITATTAGTAGNSIALTTTASGITLSGATLTGGIAARVITLQGTTLTEGSEWNANTSNDATAFNLAAAMDAVSGFTASSTANVVTVWWDAPGTAGNAKTLVTSDATNLPVSGATLSGGVAATYTPAFDVADASQVEETLIVTSKSGTNPTLDVTPQRSVDGGDSWIDDATAFAQKTNTGNETLEEGVLGGLRRYKLVTGGTDPIFGVKIAAFCKN